MSTGPIEDSPPISIRDFAANSGPFAGPGEMRALMRATDWSKTIVGPIDDWPQSLKTAVSIMLDSSFPMYIAWGSSYTQFYNDAYRPVLGATKHPAALGRSSSETFAEVWDEYVGPLFGRVMSFGKPTYIDDWMLPLDRFGFAEECYFTFCYSAIRNEAESVGGVFVTVVETTERVLSERRVATLRKMAADAAEAADAESASRITLAALAHNQLDVPFALAYLLDEDRTTLRLCGSCGIEPDEEASVQEVDVSEPASSLAGWPFREVLDKRAPMLVEDVTERFGTLVCPPWPEPAQKAALLPIALPGEEFPYGVLIAGLSPRLAATDGYRGFVDLVAGQVATAVASARAFDTERQRAKALSELDRARTQFFSNVSHEFRTPLTLLLSPVEDMLASGQVDGPAGEQLEIVHRNALRLRGLVNTLLDLSRIEAGRIDAKYQPTDLSTFTADLASNFRSAVEKGGIELHVDCRPSKSLTYVDRAMWETVVMNLLSNAFKHTFAGSIAVRVADSPTGMMLEVRDTGVGIPHEHLPNLFTRFFRVPNARSRTHEGTGIGLAFVEELARLHGGSIAVQSEEGKGSTFSVTIPHGSNHLLPEHVVEVESPAQPRGISSYLENMPSWLTQDEAPGSSRESSADGEASDRLILLADDNADMRVYISGLLGNAGWRVETAVDGRDAMDKAVRMKPDLVLADIMMPRLDGFGMLRELRENPVTATVPVILLSARAGEESRVEGLNAGADDYLVKPFSARELVARVNAHLALAQARAKSTAEVEAAYDMLRRVLEQAPVAVAVVRGPDHVFEITNSQYKQLVGGRDLIGRPLAEAFPEVDSQGLIATLDEVYRTGVPYVGRRIPMNFDRNGDGTVVPGFFNFTSSPFIRDGRIVGIITVATEITNEVVAQNEAQVAQHVAEAATIEAEKANRAKSEFLAAMSHELRTPLNAIAGYVQLLEMGVHGPINEEQRTALARVMKSEQHLLTLITDVLNFAKLEAGRVEYDMKPVNLAAVVSDAAPILEVQRSAREIEFSAEIDPAICVLADEDKLRQIVLNLLSNAVKFTDAGGSIRVDATRTSDHVILRVKDTGLGIPADKQSVIFDPFVQVHRRLTHANVGTGLGLAISRDLARAMNGDLEVESTEGEGATFFLRLQPA